MNLPSEDNRFFCGWAILVLVLIGWAIYVHSLPNAMFWDDDDFILKNHFVQNLKYWPLYFKENVIAGASLISNYWRPLLVSTFAIEWKLWGYWPPGFHAVNTFFHLADGVLLFFLLLLLFGERRLAFAVALLFVVHPVQTEAVVYVNSLGDSLSVFFLFSALILYWKSRQREKNFFPYGLSLLCYILGLLSKETGFILPGLIFLVEFFCITPQDPPRKKWRDVLVNLWPYLLLAVVYGILRATVLNFSNSFNFYNQSNEFTSNFFVRLFTFFHTLGTYVGLLLWPIDLRVERGLEWETSLFKPEVLLGGLIFCASLWLALWKGRRDRILGFGVLWFFFGIFPSSNLLVAINAVVYEHWLYVPMVGFFLILADKAIKLAARPEARRFVLGCFAVSILGFSFRSVSRIEDWRDPITFYEMTLKHAPKSYRVINNLGMMYAEAGELDKAKATYEKAVALDASNPVAHHNLANLYTHTQQTDLAIREYETAIRLDPKFLFSYGNLANAYIERKDFASARRVLEKLLSHSTNQISTLESLYLVAVMQKDYPAALGYARQAIAIEPQNQNIRKALQELERALAAVKAPSTTPYRPLQAP